MCAYLLSKSTFPLLRMFLNLICEEVESLGSPAVDDANKAETTEASKEEKCMSCYGAETAELP